MGMRPVHWLLIVAVLAFAGRPIYLCTMEARTAKVSLAQQSAPSGHCAKPPVKKCGHCDDQPAPVQDDASCMVDAGNPTAPVSAAQLPAPVLTVAAVLQPVSALAPVSRRLIDTPPVFEPPPTSIDILRI